MGMKHFHPLFARIDLGRLHANVDLIHRVAKVPLLPVIKANAYGHGAVAIAKELVKRKEVAALCVGTVAEGMELRKAGIKGRIILLDWVFPEQASDMAELGLEASVSSLAGAKALARRGVRRPIVVHVKFNTGMARLGADMEGAVVMYEKIAALKGIRIASVMTHLADSGNGGGFTAAQLELFDGALAAIKARGHALPPRHAANSGGIFLHPESRYDMVRPGISVYGVQEFGEKDAGLKPVLSLHARVSFVRDVKKGDSVSYGMRWTSPGRRKVAVVSLGYADGYHRVLSGKARAIINGKYAPQIGTICMDSAMFDVTGVDVKEGNIATLIGEEGRLKVAAVELAREAGTIAYEILCGIGRRAERFYINK
ncbi:MAG: alanine racemase [Nitrospinae bacterium]|nr:alanine racemase [Nitrospinota bacterium]